MLLPLMEVGKLLYRIGKGDAMLKTYHLKEGSVHQIVIRHSWFWSFATCSTASTKKKTELDEDERAAKPLSVVDPRKLPVTAINFSSEGELLASGYENAEGTKGYFRCVDVYSVQVRVRACPCLCTSTCPV